MKIASFVILIAMIFSSLIPATASADSTDAQLARQEANTGVVIFNGVDASGAREIGAGAIVGFNSGSGEVRILTAAHVAILNSLAVDYADGTTGKVENVRLAPDGSDAALVTALVDQQYLSASSLRAQVAMPQYHVYRIATAKPNIGDPVTIVGHPNAIPWAVSHGTVSDILTSLVTLHGSSTVAPPKTTQNYQDFSFTCADCAEGDSGGPVLDAAGEIVGIVSGAFQTDGKVYEACTQRENFATLLALAQ